MELPDVLTLAVPWFLLAILLELLFGLKNRRTRFETRDTAASLLMGTGSVASGFIGASTIFALYLWLWEHRLFDIGGDGIGLSWHGLIIAYLLKDLMYYWYHRCAHERRWIWAEHINHHSSQHYNLSTALRQSWTSLIGLNWVFYIPVCALGVHPAMLAFCSGLNLVYQFWVHTEAIGKMPRWFEAVMNTPSHHRVHHATNPQYLDANYAGTFIIWDRMFGTFVPELASDKPRYGIVKNLGTFNPLKIAFHEWWAICRDLAGARSVREVLGYTLGPPGWSPDGSRKTSAMLKAEWDALQVQQTLEVDAENRSESPESST